MNSRERAKARKGKKDKAPEGNKKSCWPITYKLVAMKLKALEDCGNQLKRLPVDNPINWHI